MINKAATRIQSRLSRKNIKVSLGDIKKVYSEKVVNVNEPTDEEIDIITNHFVNKVSKPTLFEEAINTNEFDDVEINLADDNATDEISNTSLILKSDANDNEVTEISETPQEAYQLAVSNADKQSMITTQSAALGIELTEDEAASIANTIDDVFNDYAAFLTEVTSAIKTYIGHKFDVIEDKLSSSSNDLKEYVAERNEQLNQKLSFYAGNVRGIKKDTEEIRNTLNNSKQTVLSRFRV